MFLMALDLQNKYPDENSSDKELVRAALKNVDDFSWLMKRYEKPLLRYIHRATNASREDAEDILQDIFIKVYRSLNAFDQKLSFSSWIYRIAHNEIINQHKRRVRSRTISLDSESTGGETIQDELSSNKSIQDDYIAKENSERVRKALGKLSIKYREVLVLRYFEDKDYQEISDILRKPPGTVAVLLNRAKAKFKKLAERHHLNGLS
ncbi:MAG: hypothetical protein B5M55_04615 [Desulfococcus sp. 4484_242]|nr:MAG: hypothetical protein B5M55_04615 [Desulfococcus sp. 4484_242]